MEDVHGPGYSYSRHSSNGMRRDRQERDDHGSEDANASSSQSPRRETRSTRATRATRNEGTAIAAVAAAAAEAEAATETAAAQSTVSMNSLSSSTRFNALFSHQVSHRPTGNKIHVKIPAKVPIQHITRLPRSQMHLAWRLQPKVLPRRSRVRPLPLPHKATTYARRQWRAS